MFPCCCTCGCRDLTALRAELSTRDPWCFECQIGWHRRACTREEFAAFMGSKIGCMIYRGGNVHGLSETMPRTVLDRSILVFDLFGGRDSLLNDGKPRTVAWFVEE